MAKSKVIRTRPKFNIGDIVYIYSNIYDEATNSYIRGTKIEQCYGSRTPTDTFVIRAVNMNRKGIYSYKTYEYHGNYFGYVGYEVLEYQIDKIGEVI